ncbi:uncharacterized protein LOC116336789 [Contarinia nasturtii]|uniref:uncharacterized protein LOC116336789 n=1 Tax=Contarinia nasturtii TaxID=265458 RepID=UPI0012D42535|nr:uncharacterized protein LOC116336789 [Contarinia nasturtii]
MGSAIHWGHARTSDLIHWENLPIAIEPYDEGQIFSGCCVLDKDNVTNFAPNSTEDHTDIPMVALFSLVDGDKQSQGMAYSFDNGTTWKQYHANPVIDNPGITDFRDPNVFEHEGEHYMTLAVKDRVSFYKSKDFKNWEWVGDFGIDPEEGDTSGVWECPALVTLKDDQNNQHDVLLVSENGEAKGSLFQYFIGKFNGSRFNSYNTSKMYWAEDAIDNYAAVPYHNDPLGRVILIGWMSNWLYADKIPTSTWRGQYTIPRELGIKFVGGDLYLTQRPVEELNKQISQTWSMPAPFNINANQINLTEQIPFKTGSMLKLEYAIDIANLTTGKCGLQFSNNRGEFVSFAFDVEKNVYEFNRMHSGNVSFHERFANKVMTSDRVSTSDTLFGTIVLDVASIEIFADDGVNLITAIFFPTEVFENIELISTNNDASGQSPRVQSLSVSSLKSIWSN